LDFVGIFDKLEQALSFDSADISGIVKDIETLKQRFSEMINQARKDYLILIKGKTKDKAVEAVLDYFRNDKKRQDFYEFFKELSMIYEILSPDAFLRPHIDDFDTLARMYKILIEAYEPGVIIDREFTRKTAKLVQENTSCEKIKSTLDIYEINENTLRKLQEESASDTEKVFNLLRSIDATIEKGTTATPYLHSIGEKADLISMLYKQRQIDTEEALERIKALINEINEAKKEQAEKNLPADIFTVYWILKDEKIENAQEMATSMKEAFAIYPHWMTSGEYERKLKQEILKILTKKKISAKKSVQIAKKILTVLKGAQK
jgi:type I restriction enzyme R subunit